mmetsp:Transcript_14706/g.28144  ORF Transcript_14706/g.28144 Transcript_14706/m.28144 type:complete len:307 (-) Transcript_14706:76-996(-)
MGNACSRLISSIVRGGGKTARNTSYASRKSEWPELSATSLAHRLNLDETRARRTEGSIRSAEVEASHWFFFFCCWRRAYSSVAPCASARRRCRRGQSRSSKPLAHDRSSSSSSDVGAGVCGFDEAGGDEVDDDSPSVKEELVVLLLAAVIFRMASLRAVSRALSRTWSSSRGLYQTDDAAPAAMMSDREGTVSTTTATDDGSDEKRTVFLWVLSGSDGTSWGSGVTDLARMSTESTTMTVASFPSAGKTAVACPRCESRRWRLRTGRGTPTHMMVFSLCWTLNASSWFRGVFCDENCVHTMQILAV